MAKSKRKTSWKKLWPSALAVVVAAILVLLVLEVTGVTHFFSNPKPTPTASSAKNKYSLPDGNSGSSSSSGTTKQSAAYGSLENPTGTFVSNHKPNLSGSPAPSQEQSVCNDVPGSTCVIEFSQNGITKSLQSKTIDNSGSAYWTWRLQDLGLTQGSWQISAKANLGSDTKTASDSLPLEVGP